MCSTASEPGLSILNFELKNSSRCYISLLVVCYLCYLKRSLFIELQTVDFFLIMKLKYFQQIASSRILDQSLRTKLFCDQTGLLYKGARVCTALKGERSLEQNFLELALALNSAFSFLVSKQEKMQFLD